ncbi:stress responsive A/B barrel domain-containing protein [Poronia punctata]|nr:stress responsive A/B barrel domain-containing protein [Poronia punctata]
MPVNRMLLFQYKPSARAEDTSKAYKDLLALKDNCLRSGQPYIKSLTGGPNHSPEGHEDAMQYGFVMQFDNEADRDYYVDHDEAHKAYVRSIRDIIAKVVVFDYSF